MTFRPNPNHLRTTLVATLIAGLAATVAAPAAAQYDLLRGRSPETVLDRYEGTMLAETGAQVGDLAPGISAAKWIKGDEIREFESGKVYLVDFWATWCGPCIAAMPKLTSLQKEHADDGLVVVAVNIFEKDKGDRLVTKVTEFVEKRNDMEYTVAVDSGATEQKWMRSEGRNSIPTAVLVDKMGYVSWVGNGHDPQMVTSIKSLLAEPDPAVDAVHAEKRVWLNAFVRTTTAGKVEESVEIGAALVRTTLKDDPQALTSIASTITGLVRPMRLQRILAEQAAERAAEITNEQDAGVLATLARVRLLNRERDEAISLMQRAIELSVDADQIAELEKTLTEIQG